MGAQVLFSGGGQAYARQRGVSQGLSKVDIGHDFTSRTSRTGQRYNRWKTGAALFLVSLFIAVFSSLFAHLKTRQARAYERHRIFAG